MLVGWNGQDTLNRKAGADFIVSSWQVNQKLNDKEVEIAMCLEDTKSVNNNLDLCIASISRVLGTLTDVLTICRDVRDEITSSAIKSNLSGIQQINRNLSKKHSRKHSDAENQQGQISSSDSYKRLYEHYVTIANLINSDKIPNAASKLEEKYDFVKSFDGKALAISLKQAILESENFTKQTMPSMVAHLTQNKKPGLAKVLENFSADLRSRVMDFSNDTRSLSDALTVEQLNRPIRSLKTAMASLEVETAPIKRKRSFKRSTSK